MAAIMLAAAASAYGADKVTPLYAGMAKVDISPDQAVIETGESCRLPDNIPSGKKIPPDNIHDPLYARVLVLKNNDVSLAIVSLDLILFSSKRVIDEAKKQWGVDHVILSATHTHSGMIPRGLSPTSRGQWWSFLDEDPGITVDWPGLSEDPWYAATEEKVIAAIGEAMKNLFPAHISASTQPYENPYMASNRRYVTADGKGRNRWGNPKRVPTSPRDPSIGVIRVDDDAGKPRVFMVHYACHPVLLMGSNLVSRDYPGAMADYIEQELGEDCMAMFLQGAEGDQDPYDLHQLKGETLLNAVQQSGVTLAKEALRVAKTIPFSQKNETSFRLKESMVPIAYRNGKGTTEACVTTVVINDDLALVTIPGEPLVQHQLDLRAKSPVANTFMMGVAYCGRGSPFLIYIPTPQAAKEGGYSGSKCVFVEGHAGEKMINEALACINDLLKK